MGGADDLEPALDYTRRLYGNLVDWYKTAETKAQILLSLDGIFVSLVVGSLLRDRDGTRSTLEEFGVETWAAVATVGVAISASIFCALMCVVSRVMPRAEMARRFPELADDSAGTRYPPEAMWFFQTISRLDEQRYTTEALRMTAETEARALANQSYLLSGRVLKKHLWVNRGFGFAAAALVALVVAAGSFLWRVGG